MDKLFSELFNQIESLKTVGEKALTGPLSPLGEKDLNNGRLDQDKKGWQRYLKEITVTEQALRVIVSQLPSYNGNRAIDQKLAFFRELPRRLSEGGDPEWSAYYPEIDQLLSDICQSIFKIDKTYKLGKFRD